MYFEEKFKIKKVRKSKKKWWDQIISSEFILFTEVEINKNLTKVMMT